MDLLDRPLALLYDAARTRVFDVLLSEPQPISGREVSRRAGLSATTANLKLQDLEDAGLVSSWGDGRSHRWQLRQDNLLVRQFRQLARVQDEEAARIVIEALGAEPISVVLFGSVARGESGANSDVDLLLIAADQKQDLLFRRRSYEVGRSLRAVLGRPIHVLVTYRAKFALDSGNEFIRSVLEDGRTIYGKPMTELAG